MTATEYDNYNGIVIFGEMASGKDTLADVLIELDKNCYKYNIGNVVRQFFSIIKVNPYFRGKNRLLGQTLADKLREVHPELLNDYCLSHIYEKWEKEFNWNNDSLVAENFNEILLGRLSQIKEKEIPIIVGGRTFADFNYWASKKFLTVGIVCDFEKRYHRLKLRDGDEVAKNSNFYHNTEIDVGKIVSCRCQYIIDNNKDLDSITLQANKLLKLIR